LTKLKATVARQLPHQVPKHEFQGNKRRNGIAPALAWNNIEFGSAVLNGIDNGLTFTHPGNGVVASAMGAAGLSPYSAW